MAFYGEDTPLDQILLQVKNLFQGQKSFVQPTSVNAPPDVGGYQAPLKGGWRSSGGFAPGVKRPNGRSGHLGVDMRAPAGTAIYPLAPGVVTGVGTDPLGGNVVNIQHSHGVRSYYAHLSSAKVFKGDKVDKNTVIGSVGNTGNASHTFPHLHFQVWKDNQIQDPAQFFIVPQYTPLQKGEKTWLSDDAKREAESFSMKDHVASRRVAFSNDVNKLYKLASLFNSIVSSQS